MNLRHFIRERGNETIAQELSAAGHAVTPRAVRSWRFGEKEPSPTAARALCRLYPDDLTMDDIYWPPCDAA